MRLTIRSVPVRTVTRLGDRARTRSLAGATVSVALLASLALSGCTPSSPDDSAAGAGAGTGGAAAAWGACMRDAGVPVEDPTAAEFDGGLSRVPAGVDQGAFDRASASCGADAPTSTDADRSGYVKQNDTFLACMAEHGITGFDVREGGAVIGYEGVDQETPAFQQAQPVCADEAGYQDQGL